MVNQVFIFLHDVCFKTVLVERCSCQDVDKIFGVPKKDGLRLCQIDNNNGNDIDQCTQIIGDSMCTMHSLQSKCTCDLLVTPWD